MVKNDDEKIEGVLVKDTSPTNSVIILLIDVSIWRDMIKVVNNKNKVFMARQKGIKQGMVLVD